MEEAAALLKVPVSSLSRIMSVTDKAIRTTWMASAEFAEGQRIKQSMVAAAKERSARAKNKATDGPTGRTPEGPAPGEHR